MDIQEEKLDYKLYEKLIYSRAWYYTRKFGFNFNDAKSEGNLIFCESILSYTKDKGKFSTHLWWNLCKIPQRLKKGKSVKSTPVSYIENEFPLIYDKRFNIDDYKDFAKTEISEEAYDILRYVIDYEWKEKKYTKNPNYIKLKKKFGYGKKKFDKIWNELKEFFIKSTQFDFSEAI
jgi:hypothetical protein